MPQAKHKLAAFRRIEVLTFFVEKKYCGNTISITTSHLNSCEVHVVNVITGLISHDDADSVSRQDEMVIPMVSPDRTGRDECNTRERDTVSSHDPTC